MIKKFSELQVWEEGHKLVLRIYLITKNFPKEELFGLTNQLRRAAVSITSNIAEGFSRHHTKERLQFYYQARGSLSEVGNLMIIAKDLGYIDKNEFDEVNERINKIGKLLNGLIRSLKLKL